jgi:hypothetical protein
MLLARNGVPLLFDREILDGTAPALARRVGSGVPAAFSIGPDDGAFGLARFFDRLFTLLDLGRKGGLRGLLRDRRSRLRVTRYGCGGWGC